MTNSGNFSQRHNFARPKEIATWEDAPAGLRFAVVGTARELGWKPSELRNVLCLALRTAPDRNNWSEYPNIWDEVTALIDKCEWFRVYDAIEKLWAAMSQEDGFGNRVDQFADEMNRIFREEGLGWQLVHGNVVVRGDDAFEAIVSTAEREAEASGRRTAAENIRVALGCLSERPKPNARGAAFHAMGALECIARDLVNDPQATLGEILKRYPNLVPPPLDQALSKIWGYASEEVRHITEGREVGRPEAQLVVGLAAAISSYLVTRTGSA